MKIINGNVPYIKCIVGNFFHLTNLIIAIIKVINRERNVNGRIKPILKLKLCGAYPGSIPNRFFLKYPKIIARN